MLSKQYLEREYKQAIREFKGAISEEEKWQARKAMASLERCVGEMYGYEYMDELHALIDQLR